MLAATAGPPNRQTAGTMPWQYFLILGVGVACLLLGVFLTMGTRSGEVANPAAITRSQNETSSGPSTRRRILGILGMLWGAGILTSAFFKDWDRMAASYKLGQMAGTVFGVFLFFAGFYATMDSFFKKRPRRSPQMRFEDEIAARLPLSDSGMFEEYFATGEMPRDVPVTVRKLFAQHLKLPRMNLLPDDDFSARLSNEDMERLLTDLEKTFHIAITGEEAGNAECTIRSMAQLVRAKRGCT